MNIWERELTIADFPKAGRRVEMHPCTDWWMQGARFGNIVKVDREAGILHVKLDKVHKIVKVRPNLIDPGSFNPNRALC